MAIEVGIDLITIAGISGKHLVETCFGVEAHKGVFLRSRFATVGAITDISTNRASLGRGSDRIGVGVGGVNRIFRFVFRNYVIVNIATLVIIGER